MTDNVTRYGIEPEQFLRDVEQSITVTFAPSKASGYLAVAQSHIIDAQREMVFGYESRALQTTERAKLLIGEAIALVDAEIMSRQCQHCGATMMLYCRCNGDTL